MRITRRKKFFIAGVAALGLVGGGSAIAFWTQGGSGNGSATAGTTTGITVHQTSVTSSNIYPGGSSEALSGNFTNPNASPVNITSVTATVDAIPLAGQTVNAGHPACTSADFAIGGTSGPYTVLQGTVTTWSGLTVRLLDNGLNQDNCKSVAIGITYAANA